MTLIHVSSAFSPSSRIFADSFPGHYRSGSGCFRIRDNKRWQYNLSAFIASGEGTPTKGLNDINAGGRAAFRLGGECLPARFPHARAYDAGHGDPEHQSRKAADFTTATVSGSPGAVGDVRPRNYNVTYFGVNGDGHFGVV